MLGFVPLKETTDALIAETLFEHLGQMELSIENLRRQGYDNGTKKANKMNTKDSPEHKHGRFLLCKLFLS